MSVPEHVLVIGAGLAGLRTVQGLRRAGYEGRLSLVGAEEHLPYDRPPLSKQYLAGEWDRSRIELASEDDLEELGVRTHLGRAAVALRPGEVELDDGATLHADAIVLAVGVTSRTLDGQPGSIHVLRSVDESDGLRDALADASSLLVVGAGFVGAEVASTAVDRGLAVTVVETAPVPMERLLGERGGTLVARLMTDAGIDLRTGVSVASLTATGAELSDGSTVSADETVVGIGGRLDLGWLEGSGPDLSGGIPCDERGRVEGLDGVWAVGDAAAWTDPRTGDRARLEHWTSAAEQAAAVAADIAGGDPPPATVPFFWSDQFGLKIQLIGRPGAADEVLTLHGDGLDGGAVKGTVLGYLRGDTLVAVAGFGAARLIARYRRPLSDGVDRAALLKFRDTLS
ncbi:ferredoxin reductase [Pseudonocardia sp. EC080625-04]|uniref:NAD(P)/FAD-dependent oxidoreductase n=1 Tax=Pseudonocardia sp. EC080625-04 TaxID=1096868 RepID=UPI0006CB5CE4|nr:FAD-dependent oxidoreductase [Pseudonocardia sp. EC080625-04]ALE74691.1 ferredoxin reductase [Pseudonocardia sp. EC080625-04]